MPGVPSSLACDACRKQKKKCDQRKPKCSRCARLQITCAGNGVRRYKFKWHFAGHDFGALRSTKHSVIPLPLDDTSIVDLEPDERFYLNFFRQSTSRQFACYFNRTFWNQIVHQVSEIQPAVRHAAISLAAFHWYYEAESVDTKVQLFAMKQCNTAIAYLRGNTVASLPSRIRMEMILTCCLSLVALSFMQGDAKAATCHLQSGWKILNQWQKVAMNHSPLGPVLLQAFTQVKLRWYSLAEGDMYPNSKIPSLIASQFPLIEDLEAGEQMAGFLVAIGWLALQIRSQSEQIPYSRKQNVAIVTVEKFRSWRSKIKSRDWSCENFSRSRSMTLLIEIWIEVIDIRIASDSKLEDGETRYDQYLPRFWKTIRLVQELLLIVGPDVWMGILTPVIFCAWKCRDYQLRQEVLCLMSYWPLYLDDWFLSVAFSMISKVIDIESGGLSPLHVVPEPARIDCMRVCFSASKPKVLIEYHRSGYSNVPCNGLDYFRTGNYESAVVSH